MDNALLFLLFGFGLGIAVALALAVKNKTARDQPADSLAALRHNATEAGVYNPDEQRRDASIPAPLEMPDKPRRGRPKKIPVLEPEHEPLIFTRPRRNAKLN